MQIDAELFVLCAAMSGEFNWISDQSTCLEEFCKIIFGSVKIGPSVRPQSRENGGRMVSATCRRPSLNDFGGKTLVRTASSSKDFW